MSKELVLIIILVALSTVMKICSVVALCNGKRHHAQEIEEVLHEKLSLTIKKSQKRVA